MILLILENSFASIFYHISIITVMIYHICQKGLLVNKFKESTYPILYSQKYIIQLLIHLNIKLILIINQLLY